MTDAPIYLERRAGAAVLVLNRPQTRNAISEEMWRAIPTLLNEAENAADTRILIVRGADEAFAAGADINEFEAVYATPERAARYADAVSAALDGLAAFPKPSIAEIRGPCVGGGCGLALACDFRFADATARLGITPAKLGLVYPANDTARLISTVGVSTAKDMLFTGRLLSADEALSVGLIDRCVEPDALEALVDDYVATLSAASSYTARRTKQMLAILASGASGDTEQTRAWFTEAFQGADFAEGYRAFLDKRAPKFST